MASTSSKTDPRPPNLHESALSVAEYQQFLKWARSVPASPSGVDGLLDEQEALAWIRKECSIDRISEAKVLSLFDRYPLGLEAGHFYALLRLTSWVQQGHNPTQPLIFTQTTPPVTGLKPGTPLPLPTSISESAIKATLPPPQHPSTTSVGPSQAKPTSTRDTALRQVDVVQENHSGPSSSAQVPSAKVPLPQAAPALHASSSHDAALSLAPPVPPESSKPARSPLPSSANPFRDTAVSHSRSTSLNVPSTEPLHGFDPSPNPFRQSKPKIVKPTPIVATPGNPTPVASAVEPSRVAAGTAARSMKSIDDVLSPPLPPRPAHGLDKPPPPLPPRAHISPLIQAGLEASLQVRKQKQTLPPKTFTVLHSSSSRLKASEPRLLTGESAPANVAEEVAGTMPPSKRRVSGQESRKSATETVTGASNMKRNNSDESNEPQRAVSGSATVLAAPKPSRPGAVRRIRDERRASGSHNSTHSSNMQPGRVAAPKAQYPHGTESLRTKPTLPSWLREQEELQRSALLEGRPLSPPPAEPEHEDERVRQHDLSQDLERSRREPTVLDDEYDVYPSELSEQASRAASIDRPHNPFVHRSSQAEAEKLKVQPLPRHHRGLGQSSLDVSSSKGLTRSRTLHGKDAPPPPPLLASRKRLESLPATLDSGTYAGFRHPASGGLRLVPPSAKADVGINEVKRNLQRRDSSALSVSSGSGAAPASFRGDEDSGEVSLNSTNPTSVHGLERKLSNRTDTGTAAGGTAQMLKGKVSEFLKLQDAPPKGQRPIDELKREAVRLAERKGWVKRNGLEGEGLLDVDEETAGIDNDDEDPDEEKWDDAPMPDDNYGNDSTSTNTTARDSGAAAQPVTTDGRNALGKGAPPPPPRRSATLSAAPVARRPSGFVARRASRIEERENSTMHASTSSLGRAASFSVRGSASRPSTGGASGDQRREKRASWLESFESESRRRRGVSEGFSAVDDDDSDDEGEDQEQPLGAAWQALP